MQKIIGLLLLLTMSYLPAARAEFYSPLAVGIIKPVQFPPDDFNVSGLRLSLGWGDHRDVYGLDFGLLGNITRQRFVGIGVSGLANITHGETTIIGLQLAGGANVNYQKTNVYGLQLALGVNSNSAESSVNGFQVALANLSDHTTIRGVQLGLYNKAQKVYGLQIGIVNVAESLSGLQIGLINFHRTGVFAVSPILNFGF